MARTCEVCSKGTVAGNNRSHSMRATKRKFKANLFTKNIDLGDGFKVRVKICSSCYKKLSKLGQI
ncbi:50S ribosomal protein L28 [Candidatus Absconditicoccus praedator]|uniref:50S ribosomal protein L28 n=1 Tax=Candidatus Absconditicoccus praedator TaxID=2735562 RepID=UPI001E5CBDC4|nr:50S ribosomal protein L28 [Candidatus Absconditicoccus praedator]UFX83194.1 50S ribosomal protein L28 [Candidatus Absconditicoccus praedator]